MYLLKKVNDSRGYRANYNVRRKVLTGDTRPFNSSRGSIRNSRTKSKTR